jgi:hypothetical protein
MELNVLSIIILKFLLRHNQPLDITRLKSTLRPPIEFNLEQFQKSLENLESKLFIEKINNDLSATETGRQFMGEYDLYGRKEIFINRNLKMAIIQFLFEINEKIPLSAMPEIFELHAPEDRGFRKSYNLAHYLEFGDNMAGCVKKYPGQVFELAPLGKAWYEDQVEERKKHDEIFTNPLTIQQHIYEAPVTNNKVEGNIGMVNQGKIENQSVRDIKLEISSESGETKELSKMQIKDFPKAKWYRHKGFILLILAIIVAIAIAIVQAHTRK